MLKGAAGDAVGDLPAALQPALLERAVLRTLPAHPVRVSCGAEPHDAAGAVPLGQRPAGPAARGLGRVHAAHQRPQRTPGRALRRNLHALPPLIPAVAPASRRRRQHQISLRSQVTDHFLTSSNGIQSKKSSAMSEFNQQLN